MALLDGLLGDAVKVGRGRVLEHLGLPIPAKSAADVKRLRELLSQILHTAPGDPHRLSNRQG